jgi:hypothetical protein
VEDDEGSMEQIEHEKLAWSLGSSSALRAPDVLR